MSNRWIAAGTAVVAGFGALTASVGVASAATHRANKPMAAHAITLMSIGRPMLVPAAGEVVRLRIARRGSGSCWVGNTAGDISYPSRCGTATFELPVNRSKQPRTIRLAAYLYRGNRLEAESHPLAFRQAAGPAKGKARSHVTPPPTPPPTPSPVASSTPAPTFTPPSPTVDLAAGGYSFGTYGNATVGDCAIATIGDLEQLESHSTIPFDSTPYVDTYDTLVEEQGEQPGPNAGLPETTVLQAWDTAPGIGGSTISSWSPVGTDQTSLTALLNAGTAVILNVNLPSGEANTSTETADGWATQPWTTNYPGGAPVPSLSHSLLLVGYDDSTNSAVLVSWGYQIEVSWSLLEEMVTGAWTVVLGPPTVAPTIASTPTNEQLTVGQPFSMTLSASSTDVSWSVSSDLPAGLELTEESNGQAVISGTPTGGSWASMMSSVGFTASNSGGSAGVAVTFNVVAS